MTLTGAPSYIIEVPGLGRVRYVRGEDVPQPHVNRVPERDRALFEQPQAEYAAPASRLGEIDGIGPRRLAALRRAGVETLQQLADADAGDLASTAALSTERIEDWQADAEQLLSD